ncbi:MAG: hypothetical protein LUF29_03090 [Oscillospiraceae bacterium]|nr:hypothetical protein [Oscillospiraceae bacterium]
METMLFYYNEYGDYVELPYFVWTIIRAYRYFIPAVIAIIAIFVVVKMLPFAKGHESIWIFLLSSILSIPFNMKLISSMLWRAELDMFSLKVVFCVFMYVVLYCAEEIILGSVSRKLWKRQEVVSVDGK